MVILDASSSALELAPLPSLPSLLERLGQIDQTVQQAASRLLAAPHTLPQVAPVLRALAAERRRCLRPLLDAWSSLPSAALARMASLGSEAQEAAGPGVVEPEDTELPGPVSPTPTLGKTIEAPAPVPLVAPSEDLRSCPHGEAPNEASAAEAFAAEREPQPVSPEASVPMLPALAAEATAAPSQACEPAMAPASVNQLADFAARFRAKKAPPGPVAPVRDGLLLRREGVVRELLQELGPLPSSGRELESERWVDRLVRLSSDEWLARWSVLDNALRVDLLSLLMALTRATQEAPLSDYGAIDQVFLRLVAYSRREKPGFTHGMARKHGPRRASWLDDARAAEQALRAWLGEAPAGSEEAPATVEAHVATTLVLAAPPAVATRRPLVTLSTSGEPTLTAAMPAVSTAVEVDDAPESGEIPPLVEDDWPFWSAVRGKRAVMFGGSPREPYRRRLLEVFGFASLDWIDGHVRRADSLAERLAHARVDLVLIVLPFLSHKASAKITSACKRHGVFYAPIEHGHGVLAVRRAIERFAPPKAVGVPA